MATVYVRVKKVASMKTTVRFMKMMTAMKVMKSTKMRTRNRKKMPKVRETSTEVKYTP